MLYFPSFSEGLSLRAHNDEWGSVNMDAYFPSFSEGLSLRGYGALDNQLRLYFPSFSEGLSLREFGSSAVARMHNISLPFRRDFH